MNVQRTGIVLAPNSKRVLFRPFQFSVEQRYLRIIARVMSLSEEEIVCEAKVILAEFAARYHRERLKTYFLRRFEQIKQHVPTDQPLSELRRMVIGAYLSMEYSLESAALFNPSLVWHPDQSGLPEGARRFIISLRAVGEGHLSSITFRSGVMGADNSLTLDEDSPYVTTPEVVPNASYEKALFEKKLLEMERYSDYVAGVLAQLDEHFTMEHLRTAVQMLRRINRGRGEEAHRAANDILALAQANYAVYYDRESDLSERVIFPYAPSESNGIEDARFVRFVEANGKVRYYATYTAYDGKTILPQILETTDFLHFEISTLNGPEVMNKGMALFPRKVNGQYAMISRQDGENIYIMFSEHLHFWYTKTLLLKPAFPWEFVQLGNCGSPIETEEGWLLLTHGVGPMRKYAIGAALLDKNDPTKVLGRTKTPILSPNENEREGYVPNVVYSCGGEVHNGMLILPYAMSDYASSFALIPLDEVLASLR
ncbi:MAG: glycoside hydrolase family 130 protein [Capsulimonadales bacterium]|nr:glycoside hydrolase family 130 protein [Capsulimonadales bacterium]